MAQPTSCRLAFCKFTGNQFLPCGCNNPSQAEMATQNKGPVRAATMSFKPQTPTHASRRAPIKNKLKEQKDEDKPWHSMLLPSHRAQTQGLGYVAV